MEWLIYVHAMLFGAFVFCYIMAVIELVKYHRSKKGKL